MPHSTFEIHSSSAFFQERCVMTKENLAAAREALKNNPKSTVVELRGMNHLLQDAKTGAPNEYNDIEETVSTTALKTITDWLDKIVQTHHESAGS